MIVIGCAHGTADPQGRAAVRTLLADVVAARPDLDVREAFVDVQRPVVADVVHTALAEGTGPVVVVPLLLSGGFHVHVDIAAAVAGTRAVAAAPLGPDRRLVDLLEERLVEAGATVHDAVVLAAAGSSDPRAAADVEQVAGALAAQRGGPVTVGYGSGCDPRVPQAVAAAHARLPPGGRVVLASYLLAPGFFHDRLHAAGADVVTRPLADARLVEVLLERLDAAQSRQDLPGLRARLHDRGGPHAWRA